MRRISLLLHPTLVVEVNVCSHQGTREELEGYNQPVSCIFELLDH